MELLKHIELVTGEDPAGTVIWMHGLGADGWDFVPIVRELPLPEDLALRFLFPHAPVRPVTINNGMEMRAWYDIAMNDVARLPDERGIRESQAAVERVIARERDRGIDASRIVLAGFSQGGAIALQVGLRHANRLGGIVALSTYLTLEGSLDAEAASANRATPIFMAHGTDDQVIPLQLAEASRATLQRRGYEVEWQTWPMPHAVCGEEIEAVSAFLGRIFGGGARPARSSILLAT
ncbi:MAG TPA: alpha/beta fold hydrolase [Usitatibacter sp.]|nr:alpha/beta fold hydrolase [Usitatibacter sp.]